MVLVGVGYPVGYYFDAVPKRGLDLTVTKDEAFEEVFDKTLPHFAPLEGSGGAPAFLLFLKTETNSGLWWFVPEAD